MELQILVATMHQTDESLLARMALPCAAVVVNQCDRDGRHVIPRPQGDVLWIDTPERGLSNSRNLALANATAELCLLADDDEIFNEGTAQTVVEAFAQRPNRQILSFQVVGIERPLKRYAPREQRRSWLALNRCSSVEIAFRREAVQRAGVHFHPDFGSGARYAMGEENLFLWQCLARGLTLGYVPRAIGRIHLGQSTWFTGYDERYFFNKGANFAAMSRFWSPLLSAQYALRKRRLSQEKLPPQRLWRIMLKGRREYLHAKND